MEKEALNLYLDLKLIKELKQASKDLGIPVSTILKTLISDAKMKYSDSNGVKNPSIKDVYKSLLIEA